MSTSSDLPSGQIENVKKTKINKNPIPGNATVKFKNTKDLDKGIKLTMSYSRSPAKEQGSEHSTSQQEWIQTNKE